MQISDDGKFIEQKETVFFWSETFFLFLFLWSSYENLLFSIFLVVKNSSYV